MGAELEGQLTMGKSALGVHSEELKNAEVWATDVDTVDICNREDVIHKVAQFRPDVVLHCAALTNVDGCEEIPEQAELVNGTAVKYVAQACEAVGAKLMFISTDYVFSGDKGSPYTVDDPCMPQTAYGCSKQLGERNAVENCSRTFVVRTAWLYGLHGRNFVKTILKKGREQNTFCVVNDQFGNPTNAEDLAHHILKLAVTDQYGIYHCTGKGVCSWHEFACAIAELAGLSCQIMPCTSQEYPQKAKRPAYSALDHSALQAAVGDDMRPWREALEDYIRKLGETT